MANHQPYSIYTLGVWMVKPGQEDLFILEWTAFAQWTGLDISGSGRGYLLQDEKNPFRFISYGSWMDEETIMKWRGSDAFW